MVHVIALVAYLLGSIPFGLIISKLMGYGDIRKIGSGNIGATNALRTGNKKLAALTLFFDMGKGALAVFLARHIATEEMEMAELTAVFFAVLGHIFPIWLKFKGGKGVATSLGGILVISLPIGGLMIATWIIIFLLFKISSLAAIASFTLTPFYTWVLLGEQNFIYITAICFLVILMHRTNIIRLIRREEIGFNRDKEN